jgi:hypothetical protein
VRFQPFVLRLRTKKEEFALIPLGIFLGNTLTKDGQLHLWFSVSLFAVELGFGIGINTITFDSGEERRSLFCVETSLAFLLPDGCRTHASIELICWTL